MNISLFILFIVFWGGGYLVESGGIKDSTSFSERNIDPGYKIIYPPKILFYLCGAPKSLEKPDGSIRLGSFKGQMMGLCLGVYGLAISFWTPSSLTILLMTFGITILMPYVIVYLVTFRD